MKEVKAAEKKAETAAKQAEKEVKAEVKQAEKEVKAEVKKAEEVKKAPAKKAEAEKKAPAKKAAAKKAPAKKAAAAEKVSLQYLGKDIKIDDIKEAVKKIWTGELKKKASDLESIDLYLKPEDNAAYYVLNGSFTGKVDL